MKDKYELNQPITNLLKGFRNYNIKWGSKDLNEQVLNYNRFENYYTDKDVEIMHLINDLCNNTVVASMAISVILNYIYIDYEKAVETNDEELKYISWIRYQRTMRLAEEMNLGIGCFDNTHATFDNISSYTGKAMHSLFLFKYKNNLKTHDLNLLEDKYTEFNLPEERKKEIEKICGNVFDIQIDPHKHYHEEYERKKPMEDNENFIKAEKVIFEDNPEEKLYGSFIKSGMICVKKDSIVTYETCEGSVYENSKDTKPIKASVIELLLITGDRLYVLSNYETYTF